MMTEEREHAVDPVLHPSLKQLLSLLPDLNIREREREGEGGRERERNGIKEQQQS